jgi:hypothetical protein
VVASDGDDTCSFAHAFIYSFICAFKKYVWTSSMCRAAFQVVRIEGIKIDIVPTLFWLGKALTNIYIVKNQ